MCGADLTEWRAAQSDGDVPSDQFTAPELVWRGTDPVVFGRAVSTLAEAGIPQVSSSSARHMVFGLAVASPQNEIRVAQQDAEEACALIGDDIGSPPLAVSDTALMPVPGDEIVDAEPSGVSATSSEAVIWSGEDADFAHRLRVALHENGLATKSFREENGVERILVDTGVQQRAREIMSALTSDPPEGALETAPEYPARKAAFQRGAVLALSALLMAIWVSILASWRAGGWSIHTAAAEFIYWSAVIFLIVGGVFLAKAWAIRGDKLGLLSLLFLYVVVVQTVAGLLVYRYFASAR